MKTFTIILALLISTSVLLCQNTDSLKTDLRKYKIEDFEYITKSKKRFNGMIGISTNQFVGESSKYLAFGFGFMTDINYTTRKNLIIGLTTKSLKNNLSTRFPLNIQGNQKSPNTGFLGIYIGTWFKDYSLQGCISLVTFTLSEKNENYTPQIIRFNGWSPFIKINCPLRNGKERISKFLKSPSLAMT